MYLALTIARALYISVAAEVIAQMYEYDDDKNVILLPNQFTWVVPMFLTMFSPAGFMTSFDM